MKANKREVSDRFLVYERDGYICQYCGDNLDELQLTVDHVIPKSLGGKFSPSNLITSCRECNSIKGDLNLETFRLRMNLRSSGIGFISTVQALRLINAGIDLKLKNDFKFYFELSGAGEK